MKVVSINISPGGIPKRPQPRCRIGVNGLDGDGHHHAKHGGPDRAVTLLDLESIESMRGEGYDLVPGTTGENLTVSGLNVQALEVGDRLAFINPDGSDGPELELARVRNPCFVLDEIDPALKKAAVGRLGYLARVRREGEVHTGARIIVLTSPVAPA